MDTPDVRWLVTCTEDTIPPYQTYATEQAADDVIRLHAGACRGDHAVEPLGNIDGPDSGLDGWQRGCG